jgi:hypothetical protein
MYKILYSLNNGALNSKKVMPEKDSTTSSFEMARLSYIKILQQATTYTNQQKYR